MAIFVTLSLFLIVHVYILSSTDVPSFQNKVEWKSTNNCLLLLYCSDFVNHILCPFSLYSNKTQFCIEYWIVKRTRLNPPCIIALSLPPFFSLTILKNKSERGGWFVITYTKHKYLNVQRDVACVRQIFPFISIWTGKSC